MDALSKTSLELRKQVTQAVTQINLMRNALHRVDSDFEKSGTVSCETMEYVRRVKGLLA